MPELGGALSVNLLHVDANSDKLDEILFSLQSNDGMLL